MALGTAWAANGRTLRDDHPGAIVVTGRVFDGAGAPVTDALLEFWQADEAGRFPRAPAPAWTGFTRVLTGPDGGYCLVTLKPGPVPGPGGQPQAPNINVSIFARGLLQRLVTRIYFSDEEANVSDPVLSGIDGERRETLLAVPSEGAYHFDIRLQGERETVFFDLW